MKLAKWGNSLAIRIPADVVESLGLQPDDDAEIRITGKHSFEVIRDRRREEALETLRGLRVIVPAGFEFNRDEVYDR